jgi:iron complex transport system permease protein
VVVSAFFTALHGLIQYTADAESKLPSLVYWLIGSFAAANAHKVGILAPPVLCAGSLLLLLRWRINLLSLDERDAEALGERTSALRWVIFGLVALIVAAQVSVSGIVGWVGLIVPHFARMIVGADHRRLLPASAMTGAIFLIVADDIGRTLAPQELPIGMLTAIVGAPLFALMFWRNQARNRTGGGA